MTPENNTATKPFFSASLAFRMLTGWGIALLIICAFIFPVRNPDPAWGEFWRIQPLVVTPLAGAAGGLFYHLMEPARALGGWKKVLTIITCVIVYIIGLWMGIVLGLHGTLWN